MARRGEVLKSPINGRAFLEHFYLFTATFRVGREGTGLARTIAEMADFDRRRPS